MSIRGGIKAEYVRFNHRLIPIIARANATGEFAEIEATEEEFYDQILTYLKAEIEKMENPFLLTPEERQEAILRGIERHNEDMEQFWNTEGVEFPENEETYIYDSLLEIQRAKAIQDILKLLEEK